MKIHKAMKLQKQIKREQLHSQYCKLILTRKKKKNYHRCDGNCARKSYPRRRKFYKKQIFTADPRKPNISKEIKSPKKIL